jgi:hypothetical protein
VVPADDLSLAEESPTEMAANELIQAVDLEEETVAAPITGSLVDANQPLPQTELGGFLNGLLSAPNIVNAADLDFGLLPPSPAVGSPPTMPFVDLTSEAEMLNFMESLAGPVGASNVALDAAVGTVTISTQVDSDVTMMRQWLDDQIIKGSEVVEVEEAEATEPAGEVLFIAEEDLSGQGDHVSRVEYVVEEPSFEVSFGSPVTIVLLSEFSL